MRTRVISIATAVAVMALLGGLIAGASGTASAAPSGYEVVRADGVTLGTDGTALAEVNCPVGKIAIGGGGYASMKVSSNLQLGGPAPSFPLLASLPSPDSDRAWRIVFTAPAYPYSSNDAILFHAFAVCVS